MEMKQGIFSFDSLLKKITVVTIIIFVTAISQQAQATPVLPTTDLPLSSIVQHTIERPVGETWAYTGGTYDINNPTNLIACRYDGNVDKFSIQTDTNGNVTGATPLGSIFLGISEMHDIVAAPGGYAATGEKNDIIFLDSNLNELYTTSVTGMDITDLHAYTTLDTSTYTNGLDYTVIFSTLDDGIRLLTDKETGASVKIADGTTYSVGGMDLDKKDYTNNLFTANGVHFKNIDDSVNPFGSSVFVNMQNYSDIMGDVFGKGYVAEIQPTMIQLHNSLEVQDSQIMIPEPATMALLGLASLIAHKRRRH